jgi:putative transferase (TIGR04331 family)
MPMSTDQLEAPFLATTALEEFWDTGRPLIFLGEWCLLHERRAFHAQVGGSLLDSPYTTAGSAEAAHARVDRLYEQLLPQLGAALNKIHGRNHSDRYWRIVIGPWLQLYLAVVHDRFVCLSHALDRYPACSTIGLSEASFVVPVDTLDFAAHVSEDAYNLQVFTKLLGALGRQFPRKEFEVPRNPLYAKMHGDSWKRRAINLAVGAYAGVCAMVSRTVLLRNVHFSSRYILELTLRNFGRVLPDWKQMTPSVQYACDTAKRGQLRTLAVEDSEFGRCLVALLFEDVPQCFIEGYAVLEKGACAGYPKRVKAIFSANGWYYDELFKLWAAKAADEGTLLLGTQHGGDYGSLKVMPSEDHETALVDYYYSWGWSRTDRRAQVIPMPATKLAGRKVIGADNSKQGILWVATTAPRYHLLEAPTWNSHFREYLKWHVRFAKALPAEVMQQVRFRPHYINHGWSPVERLRDCVPGIAVESWQVPFQVSLENCRLYVCDHFSTTFAEALAANKPTILFCNPLTNKFRADAQPHFDLLRQNGILFDTPEDAATAVAAVHADIEAWWNAPQRQAAIQSFCYRYARTSPEAFKLWSRELGRVSGLRSRQ